MDIFMSQGLVWFCYTFLVPFMVILFLFSVFARVVIYITVKSEWAFSAEFENRVEKFIVDENKKMDPDFHDVTGELLHKTHFEFYELKAKRRARRMDYPITFFERVFSIAKASDQVIEDTLKQTQYVKHQEEPDFDRMAKYVFGTNPYFNRFLGTVPKNIVDDITNSAPSLLIICGILGTFVGIVAGIPALKLIDVTNIEATSKMLDTFLNNMGFSLTSSILGMILSLALTMLNTALAPYALYVDLIDIYKNSLSFVWQECERAKKMINSKESSKKSINS